MPREVRPGEAPAVLRAPALRPERRGLVGPLLLFVLAWLVTSGAALAPDPAKGAGAKKAAAEPTAADCLACHGDKDLTRDHPGPGQSPSLYVDARGLEGSVHGGLECVSCHQGATAPHEGRLKPVRCAECHDRPPTELAGHAHGGTAGRPGPACAACHGTHAIRPASTLDTATCAACHPRQVTAYRDSVHGRSRQRGVVEAATCSSCHGTAHTVLTRTDPRAPTYHLNLPRTCAACHGNAELAKRFNIPVGNVYQAYMDSIHGRAVTRSGLLVAANCSDCHGVHDIKPKADPTSHVARAHIPATCGKCHAGVLAAYQGSIHGQGLARGNPEAPVCTSCHSAHHIRRVEGTPWELEVIAECGTCHRESLTTYRDTFHGKVTALGGTRAAKCADCHGSHDILPASSPASKVSTTNVVATCRQCHPQATFSFAQFRPHANPHDGTRFPTLHYAYVGMTGLLVFTFAFFGLHTVLWLPRSFQERLRRNRGTPGGPDRP